MKKIALFVVVLLCAVSAARAFDEITQSASVVSNKLPRLYFYDQVNDALYKVTATDLPAVIAALNEIRNGMSNGVSEVYASNVTAKVALFIQGTRLNMGALPTSIKSVVTGDFYIDGAADNSPVRQR